MTFRMVPSEPQTIYIQNSFIYIYIYLSISIHKQNSSIRVFFEKMVDGVILQYSSLSQSRSVY